MAETAEQQLDRKVRALMASSGRTYTEALSMTLTLDTKLRDDWVRETLRRPVRR